MISALVLGGIITLALVLLVESSKRESGVVFLGVDADKVIIRKGLFRRRNVEHPISGIKWISTRTVQGGYTQILWRQGATVRILPIRPGAASFEMMRSFAERNDLNLFNEECYHGGFCEQVHQSVMHPMSLNDWLEALGVEQDDS